MITDFEKSYRVSDNLFREAKVIIERSHAAEMIDDFHDQHRGAGGQDCAGIAYTISAVLVAALGLLMLGRTPTYKAIQQAIGDLTPRQLAEVGMAGQDTSRIFADRAEQRRERTRFVAWLNRRLAPLDPSPDQPARRITNAEHRRIIAHRSTEQRAASVEATERLRTVLNRIVFGSIVDPRPPEAVGDIVADETIFDLAGPSAGLGIKPDKQRGAAYFGSYYSRDKHSTTVYQDASGGGKRGFGIGLTAVIRVGPPEQLHAVAPVVIGMDVHPPTSGSVDGLDVAITYAKRNGLDTRRAGRARLPRFTTDMGYNPKDGFARLMLDHQYAAVVRYPQHWTLTDTAANPPGATTDVPPGQDPVRWLVLLSGGGRPARPTPHAQNPRPAGQQRMGSTRPPPGQRSALPDGAELPAAAEPPTRAATLRGRTATRREGAVCLPRCAAARPMPTQTGVDDTRRLRRPDGSADLASKRTAMLCPIDRHHHLDTPSAQEGPMGTCRRQLGTHAVLRGSPRSNRADLQHPQIRPRHQPRRPQVGSPT